MYVEEQVPPRTNLQKVNWPAPRWLRRRRKQAEVGAGREFAAAPRVADPRASSTPVITVDTHAWMR